MTTRRVEYVIRRIADQVYSTILEFLGNAPPSSIGHFLYLDGRGERSHLKRAELSVLAFKCAIKIDGYLCTPRISLGHLEYCYAK